jgi:DnaJ-class molecular chaperone
MSFKFYDYLNISRDASHADIKKAFKKLAVEHHPDKGGDTEVFKNISQAYEVLSDPEKRQLYDMSGGDENFTERQPSANPGMSFNDIFNGIFKNVGKKRNSHITIELTLEEVYNGCTKKLKLELEKSCGQCSKVCKTCIGSGMEQMKIQLGPFMQIINQPCNKCNGRGTFRDSVGCLDCNGTSKIIEKVDTSIDIPPGITEKHNIVKQGFGEQPTSNMEKPGDLVINFKYKPHPIFEVNDGNLIYKLDTRDFQMLIIQIKVI